jgi:2-polyprenyl-6-methoxyphenol hydroxylase-like FAD-dependent oxidoreductase
VAIVAGGKAGRQVDVIVVGAGPVGFLTALGLARHGLEVRLLEAEAVINDSPRAAVYFPTTVKFLDQLGVLEDACEVGLQSTEFCYWVPEHGVRVPVDTSIGLPAGEKYPYNLHFWQHILAQLVMRHLERLPNAAVLFNHRVTALAQDSSGVTLTVESPDGPVQMRSGWVVGTDGARSTVRHLLGLPFEGHTWPERFVATNLRYDFAKYGYLNANMVQDPVNWAVVARLGLDNLWRCTYGEDSTLPEEEVLRRVPEHYEAIFRPSGKYEIVAASSYRVHERCAPKFRVGRALLARDAAHVCNPCGGMGLTTGVIDAMQLVDYLASVIGKRRDESVLDFYATERRRVYLEVTTPIATGFKQQLAESDPEKRAAGTARMRAMAVDPSIASSTHLAELLLGRPLPQ